MIGRVERNEKTQWRGLKAEEIITSIRILIKVSTKMYDPVEFYISKGNNKLHVTAICILVNERTFWKQEQYAFNLLVKEDGDKFNVPMDQKCSLKFYP